MEILLGTNAECTEFVPWNNSEIILDFFFSNLNGFKLEIFLKNFSYGKNFKLLRKDSQPIYLRIGIRKIYKHNIY
jgi:hypothetical protein